MSLCSPPKSAEALTQAVLDLYRCPSELLEWSLTGDLSADEVFFRFGAETCFGRSCAGTRKVDPEYPQEDVLGEVVVQNSSLRLPFNPTEVIDNLRRERYWHGAKSSHEGLLRKVYYHLRPFMNQGLRSRVQRFRARGWHKISFPKWPVDTTVEDLCQRLLLLSMQAKKVEKVPFIWFWPEGAAACVTMTHDVETEAGRAFCADLMDLNDSFGIKSSFQIVPEERYEVSPDFLDSLRSRGFEVAVHDLNHDGKLYHDREEFVRRAKGINRYGVEWDARGFRAGVLYRNPEWFEALNFSYDMSIPNVAHLDPQPGGCCTVLPYFIGEILEIPVTVIQDYMLFHLLEQYSIDLWRDQIELILQKNGLANFIVHPDYILDAQARSVYRDLLSHVRELREKNVWVALPGEIDRWWRARDRMSVVSQGDSFVIEGEGAERAVLAFAKIENGQLVYELAQSKLGPFAGAGWMSSR